MGVVQTESWTPTVAAPAVTYNVGAGVTPRVGLQITNNTLFEVWVLDSPQPPVDKNQAKYVIPPRCTATYPLDSSTMSARWNGPINTPGDSVDFVFTDEPTVPQVWPGIIPTGGTTAPVQSVISNRNNLGTWPLTLTTSTGLNIGSVYIYNNTRITWYIQTSVGGFKRIFIDAYSWACIPLNQLSGTVEVNTLGSLANGLAQNDAFYVAWSDINYSQGFPAGAGKLPDPMESSAASRVLELPSLQFCWSMGVGGAGPINLGSLGPNAGAPQRVIITMINVEVRAGAAPASATVRANQGFDGISAAADLLVAVAPTNGADSCTSTAKVALVNLNNVGSSFVILIGGGTVSGMSAEVFGFIDL